MQIGTHIQVDMFNVTLNFAVNYLAPSYRKFILSAKGHMACAEFLDAEADIYYLSALMIQNKYRKRLARMKVQRKREEEKKRGKVLYDGDI